MPDEKLIDLAAFRLIRGSKQEPAPAVAAEEEEPTSDVVTVLENALEEAKGTTYRRVFIIFEHDTEPFDFMYSTSTDPEKLMMIARAEQWVLKPETDEES